MERDGFFILDENKRYRDVISKALFDIGLKEVSDIYEAEYRIEIFSSQEEMKRLSDPHCGSCYTLFICCSEHCFDINLYWDLLSTARCDITHWSGENTTLEYLRDRISRWRGIDRILNAPLVRDNLIGRSDAWMNTLRETIEAACFSDCPILLLGESGTGKEMLARLIHSVDQQRKFQKLVVLDCSTIVPELSGSEFFGHEKGAFTGAHSNRDGAFSLADNGSLFLDEIGELPLHLQAQLLRVIQEKCFKRVGGNQWCRTDFRLICATNRDLEKEAAQGTFRPDLFYRIATKVIRLPPLRERCEDIIPLAEHFLSDFFPNQTTPTFTTPVRQYLVSRDYPGNIRHLRQLISRIALKHCGGGDITVGSIPLEDRLISNTDTLVGMRSFVHKLVMMGKGLKEIGRSAEDIAIDIAMRESGGNTHQAASLLHISDRTLQLRKADARE
jgi:transcriptional regulator with GAF, ATPase, and Fis domain